MEWWDQIMMIGGVELKAEFVVAKCREADKRLRTEHHMARHWSPGANHRIAGSVAQFMCGWCYLELAFYILSHESEHDLAPLNLSKVPKGRMTNRSSLRLELTNTVMRCYTSHVSDRLTQTLRTDFTNVTLVSEDTYWTLYWCDSGDWDTYGDDEVSSIY